MSTQKESNPSSGGLSLDALSLEPIEESKPTVSAIDLVDLQLPEEEAGASKPPPAAASEAAPEPPSPPPPKKEAALPPQVDEPPKPAERPAPPKEPASGEGAEQFFQPHVRRAPQTAAPPPPAKKPLDPKLLAGAGGGALVVVALLGWLLMGGEKPAEPEVTAAPAAPTEQLPPDVAATKSRMTALGRAAKVWMIQFGAGYNPSQVTVERLKSDVGVPEAELVDGWGTPLRYLAKEKGFVVRSAGPDKAFDTADDLVQEETVPQ